MNLHKMNHYRNRLLQELSLKTGYSFARPTGCIVLLTNRCNSRCLHCHSWKLRPDSEELSTREWERVLHQMRAWLGRINILMTGGETLLKQDGVHLAAYAASKGFIVEFLSNGYLIDSETAKELVKSGVTRITLSLDGSTADIHDRIRGRNGFYDRVTNAFRFLVREKEDQKSDVVLWAKTSIMSYNVHDLTNIAGLALDLGISGVKYQALEPVYYSSQLKDKKWYENNPLWIQDPQDADRSVKELIKMKNQQYPILNSVDNLNMIRTYFHDPDNLSYRVHTQNYSQKKPRCRSWIGGLQIMPDGGLKMCHHMQPFAHTRDGHIKNLWNNRARCWKTDCGHYDY